MFHYELNQQKNKNYEEHMAMQCYIINVLPFLYYYSVPMRIQYICWVSIWRMLLPKNKTKQKQNYNNNLEKDQGW